MQTTNIDIQIIKNDFHSNVDSYTLDNVIFAEDSDELHVISQITLSGQYNKVYNVLTDFMNIVPNRICADGDILLIALFEELAVVDLTQDKLARVIRFDDCWGIQNICKFKSGYFIHCEGRVYFLDRNFNILWDASCGDTFVNIKLDKFFESHEDYIAVFDWWGLKHYYNESGEFKCEDYPQFNCHKNN